MNYLTIILFATLIITVLALALYLVGFRLKKLTVKGGFVEAELEREPTDAEKPPTTPAPSTTVHQRAAEGGPSRIRPSKPQPTLALR